VQELTPAGAHGSLAPDPSAGVEDRDLVRRGLAQLSPEEREAIALRYGADLDASRDREAEERTTLDQRGSYLPGAADGARVMGNGILGGQPVVVPDPEG